MTIEKVCRVCLSECDELTPLWVKLPGENKTLEETINFVVNINIKLEDGLPDKICKICESVLDLADTFKQRCLESESILEQKAKEKRSEESRPNDEKNHQGNIEINTEDTSCLPTSIPRTSVTDTSRVVTENDGNIHYIPKHTIKIEFEESHVDAGMSMSEQEDFVTIKEEKVEPMFKQCLIKEEFSAETEKYSNNEETFACPHCNMTFWTKFSYKVHIHFHHASLIHGKDTSSLKTPNLDNMQPTTAAVRSPTEDPAAADTSTDTIIKTERDCDKIEKMRVIRKKKNEKNLRKTGEKISIKKESTKDTATMLKLSGTNTDDKITGATETQSNCIDKAFTNNTKHVHTCHICGYTTAIKKRLTTHLKAHAAPKHYSCDSCLYLTTSLANFNDHVKIHKGEKKPFACEVCGKRFRVKKSIVKHARTHTGYRPFSCDECGKSFNCKFILENHSRRCKGEKPHTCTVCEKKFSVKYDLDTHLRTHTGEKPYSCGICQKSFSVKSTLIKHYRIHTGVKPYSCERCDKKFSQKSSLDKHMRTHRD